MQLTHLCVVLGGFIIAITASCNNDRNSGTITPSDEYTIKTFRIDSSGWGYDIYKNNKPLIHQPLIPSINRNMPFETEEMALKTAQLVIRKLKNKEFPPSVSKEEIDSLNP